MKLIKDIMTPGVHCVRPDATLTAAAKLMADLDVGALPVCEDDRLAGVITDRDITVRAVARGRDPAATRVREAMTEDIFHVYEDDTVESGAHLLEAKKVRRVPVINRQMRLVGIVSLGDVAINGSEALGGAALKEISAPSLAPVGLLA